MRVPLVTLPATQLHSCFSSGHVIRTQTIVQWLLFWFDYRFFFFFCQLHINRVTWEEKTSIEELFPSDWPVENFLDWAGQVRSLWVVVSPWADGPGLNYGKQAREQHFSMASASVAASWFFLSCAPPIMASLDELDLRAEMKALLRKLSWFKCFIPATETELEPALWNIMRRL